MNKFILPLTLVVAVVVILCACNTSPKQIVSELSYFKDHKTNLCFAGKFLDIDKLSGASAAGLLTYVPCTPEVEHQIELSSPKKELPK